MSYDGRIVTRISEGVCRITVDNPAKANCLTSAMFEQLTSAWKEVESNDDVIAIVLEASGDRYFSAGADVTMFRQATVLDQAATTFAASSRQCGVTKPVIAAVSGKVVGGGLGLVADSDVVLAVRSATFTDPHVRHGQVCGYGAWRLAERLPIPEVVRMTLADVPLTAERAYQVGLVSELHDTADEVRAAARDLAQRIARHSPTALVKNLDLLHKLSRDDRYDAVIAEAQSAMRRGWEDAGTAAALTRWSNSQS